MSDPRKTFICKARRYLISDISRKWGKQSECQLCFIEERQKNLLKKYVDFGNHLRRISMLRKEAREEIKESFRFWKEFLERFPEGGRANGDITKLVEIEERKIRKDLK